MICPKCNKEFEAGKFCPECGTPLQEKINFITCPSCGAQNPEGSNFCAECGTRLSRTSGFLKKAIENLNNNNLREADANFKSAQKEVKSPFEGIGIFWESWEMHDSDNFEEIQGYCINAVIKESTEKLRNLTGEIRIYFHSEDIEITTKEEFSTGIAWGGFNTHRIGPSLYINTTPLSQVISFAAIITYEKEGGVEIPVHFSTHSLVCNGTLCYLKGEESQFGSYDDSDFNFLHNMVKVEGGVVNYDSKDYNIDPFYICKFPVSIYEWQEIMGDDNDPTGFDYGDTFEIDGVPDWEMEQDFMKERPVYRVNWFEVQDFIERINEMFPGHNFRLPTVREWIYAARGGSKQLPFKYPGSDNIDDVAWYKKNSDQADGPLYCDGCFIHRFGKKKPNTLGLYDMTGNIVEWTSTAVSTGIFKDKEDPQGEDVYVCGGNAWTPALFCKIDSTILLKKTEGDCHAAGFRLVCDII